MNKQERKGRKLADYELRRLVKTLNALIEELKANRQIIYKGGKP